MRGLLRGALCVLLLHPVASEGQQLDSLQLRNIGREIGSEVLIGTRMGRVRGRLTDVSPDTLRIDQAIGPRAILFSGRDSLWVREPLGKAAALYGAIAGIATAGGILLFFRSMCGSGDDPCTGFGRAAWILGTRGAAFGAAAGLLLGGGIKHWVRKNP